MDTTTSTNGTVTRKQQCPCGLDTCYTNIEGNENDLAATTTSLISESNFVFGRTPNFVNIHNALPPYVGQNFQTDDEAFEYYTAFARKNGFLVRRERSKGNPDHPMGVYKRELVCHRAGPPLPRKTEDLKRQRNRKASRCKCEAQMVIKKTVDIGGVTRWAVVNFNNIHNHELMDVNDLGYPSIISGVDRERIIVLAKSGQNESDIIRSLEMVKGVEQGELPFTEGDVRNFLKSSRAMHREGETNELLKICRSVKEKDPDFRYEYTLDENNKPEHVAWTYATAIKAFKVFGDVVVFDTSYHLNGYDNVVVWFGVDNHGSTIFFACAILLDEKPGSFSWAFQAFIRLMEGKHPLTILTDFSLVLKDVIYTELQDTKHAVPKYHVISRLSSWFSSSLGSEFEKFKTEFEKLYELETTEEFEHRWVAMIDDFALGFDRHINLLYSLRPYWALPYLQGCFFGGLFTNGRIVSFKSFFKGFFNPQTRLKDFVEQVGLAVDFQNQAESPSSQNPQETTIKTYMPIEEHASTVFTSYAFSMFQKEIMASTEYAVYETVTLHNYLVRHYLRSEGGHIVNCIPSNEELQCSCKGFESLGILCRHTLRLLSLKNGFSIPEKYILPRWRNDISLFPKSNGLKYRSQALRSLASTMIQESAITKDRFEYAEWHLCKLLDQVREMPSMDDATLDLEISSCVDDDVDIVTAPSITRGRPRKAKTAFKLSRESQGLP